MLMFLATPSYYLTPALAQGNPLQSLTKPLARLLRQMPRGICNLLLNPFVGLYSLMSHTITMLGGGEMGTQPQCLCFS